MGNGAGKRRQLPPWAMGLAIAPLGFYYGFVSTALPILLRARRLGGPDCVGLGGGLLAHVLGVPALPHPGCEVQQADVCADVRGQWLRCAWASRRC